MADIYWGLIVICGLGALSFYVAWSFSQRWPLYINDVIALCVVIAIFIYIRYLWYNARLVSVLPYSNLIVLGNWFPIAAGALGGLAWSRIPGRIYRKCMFVGALASASVFSVVSPLMGEPPLCMDVWRRGVCIQTTDKTCTPACAATLLRSHGIEATEREMADLCLTRQGTTWLGLYRALKLKTANTAWDVEVISCEGKELLDNGQGPMILNVGLPSEPTKNQQVAMSEWGWKRGIGHSVILVKQTQNGRLLIADPTPGVGHEEWTANDIQLLFRGTAIRLVKRS